MMHNWGFGMGWGLGGGLVGLLVLIALIVGAVYLIRHLTGGPRTGGRSPGDTLNERYAKGEITREEYLQVKKDIGEQGEEE